ncbi:MAG: Re/Si-specific NAD(P)(+) transhydrogenase subunit alpha [Planctomycetes bacterium]|nr:Re/Si-specific NAD(P)(+) transhydrogenase subunit alpha [Planctomycetota bacterium]
MKLGIIKETFPGETRVAAVPATLAPLQKAGLTVIVESGAGMAAGFPDHTYADRGALVVPSRAEVFAQSDLLAQVRTLGANLEAGITDLGLLRSGQTVLGFSDPLTSLDAAQQLAARGVNLLAMELIPRITRAQSMDALSSMATISGYKAVLLAAAELPKMFPMMMTAAGTISPAKVLVLGAGVAGLQAIASARRLGAVVEAYDVRAVVKEQVQSLGAKFLDLPLETTNAQDKGGYAKALDDETIRKQRELLTKAVAANDVVITTAAVPGKKAPVMVTREMVEGMTPGSVVCDLAAERGGNCELTKPGETITYREIRIMGPLNLPATVPHHASQMYAKNVATLLCHLVHGGEMKLNLDDEITRESLVVHGGQVVNQRVKDLIAAAGH